MEKMNELGENRELEDIPEIKKYFSRIYTIFSKDIREKLRDLNVEIATEKRGHIFETILKTNGVQFSRGILTTNINKDYDDFQKKLILYIKAITTIIDMEMLEQPHIRHDFKSTVWRHIDEKKYNRSEKNEVDIRDTEDLGK